MALIDRVDLVILDMDGTIVQYKDSSFHSSWDAIGIASGKGEEWMKILQHYYPLPELYPEWFQAQCDTLKGVSVEKVCKSIFPPPYTPGFKEFCAYLDDKKIKKGIVSSGVDLVANEIKKEVGLDFVVASELQIEDGNFSGRGIQKVPLWDKCRIVEEVMNSYGADPSRTAYFGDNENDIGSWNKVGIRVGISLKKSELYSCVDHHFSDFEGAIQLFQKELTNNLNNICPLVRICLH